MNKEVKEYIKTLKPITDFSLLKKGDKIFNRESLSINYIDKFDRIENWNGKQIIFYTNSSGESWNGVTEDYWFFIENRKDK